MKGSVGKGDQLILILFAFLARPFDTATHSIFIAKLVIHKLCKWMIGWIENNWLNCWVATARSKSSWWLVTSIVPWVSNTVIGRGKCFD